MGKRGPKKEPTVLKLIKGNPGKRPINKREPKPEPGLPKCPAHLNDLAKLEWRRVAKELDSVGLLTKLDRAVLAAYCKAWGRWVDPEEKLTELGSPLFKTPSGGSQAVLGRNSNGWTDWKRQDGKTLDELKRK